MRSPLRSYALGTCNLDAPRFCLIKRTRESIATMRTRKAAPLTGNSGTLCPELEDELAAVVHIVVSETDVVVVVTGTTVVVVTVVMEVTVVVTVPVTVEVTVSVDVAVMVVGEVTVLVTVTSGSVHVPFSRVLVLVAVAVDV
jgi:hypothetical protein